MTSFTFTAERHAAAAAAIDRYLLPAGPGPQQQTRHSGLRRSIDGTDRRTDGHSTSDRYIDPVWHTMRACSNKGGRPIVVYFSSHSEIYDWRLKNRKGSPFSIAERRVPELIPVLGRIKIFHIIRGWCFGNLGRRCLLSGCKTANMYRVHRPKASEYRQNRPTVWHSPILLSLGPPHLLSSYWL